MVCGYALMLPRALYIQDFMWSLAMAWGTLLNWVILAILQALPILPCRQAPVCPAQPGPVGMLHLNASDAGMLAQLLHIVHSIPQALLITHCQAGTGQPSRRMPSALVLKSASVLMSG